MSARARSPTYPPVTCGQARRVAEAAGIFQFRPTLILCSLTPPSRPTMRRSIITALLLCPSVLVAQGQLTPTQAEARDIFRELIEINTAWKAGSTSPAARAVARRFLAAGVPAGAVTVIGPAGDKDSSVVVRIEGTAKNLKPILLMAHLDVVEALRSDWSLDPFKLIEKDGIFYGRGTSDIKGGAT